MLVLEKVYFCMDVYQKGVGVYHSAQRVKEYGEQTESLSGIQKVDALFNVVHVAALTTEIGVSFTSDSKWNNTKKNLCILTGTTDVAKNVTDKLVRSSSWGWGDTIEISGLILQKTGNYYSLKQKLEDIKNPPSVDEIKKRNQDFLTHNTMSRAGWLLHNHRMIHNHMQNIRNAFAGKQENGPRRPDGVGGNDGDEGPQPPPPEPPVPQLHIQPGENLGGNEGGGPQPPPPEPPAQQPHIQPEENQGRVIATKIYTTQFIKWLLKHHRASNLICPYSEKPMVNPIQHRIHPNVYIEKLELPKHLPQGVSSILIQNVNYEIVDFEQNVNNDERARILVESARLYSEFEREKGQTPEALEAQFKNLGSMNKIPEFLLEGLGKYPYFCRIRKKPIRHIVIPTQGRRIYYEKAAIDKHLQRNPQNPPPGWPEGLSFNRENMRSDEKLQDTIDATLESIVNELYP